MEEFSYTVSHDLRSPMRSMGTFAQILLEDYGPGLDATGRGHLERIARASERMQRMTTDLLSYSRVARSEVKLEPCDLEKIVAANVDSYSELQPPTEMVVRQPLLPVLAYPPSLSQCVGNLLTNAAKFVHPGESARITVRTERRGGNVRLWVEDEGIGIPPRAQPSLFKIFERGTAERRYQGTGIGLAMVRKAVEKMGGSCGLESDGVKGSRFWIELPSA
jgi:signal transduction histidine kinase